MAKKKKATQGSEESLEQGLVNEEQEPTITTTSEIELEESHVDRDELLSQLRIPGLSTVELVKLAQQFAPLLNDLSGLLHDEDESFQTNLLTVLWRCNHWSEEAAQFVLSESVNLSSSAQQYILRIIKQNPSELVPIVTSVLTFSKAAGQSAIVQKNITALLDEMSSQVIAAIVSYGSVEYPQALQQLFNGLLENADEKYLSRLMFDGSSAIRRATLRHLTARSNCSIGLLSTALVLLKDSDSAVSRLTLHMLMKHGTFAELVIPQVFGFMLSASPEERMLAIEVIKKFDGASIPSILSLFADTRDGVDEALEEIMISLPQRWISPLIGLLLSYSTPEYVANRVERFLRRMTNKSSEYAPEVYAALGERENRIRPKDPILPKHGKPEITSPSVPLPMEGFDTRLLTEKEMKKSIKSVELSDLISYLNDGRQFVKHNAVNLAKVLKIDDIKVLDLLKNWMRTDSIPMALDAQNAIATIFSSQIHIPILFEEYKSAELTELRDSAFSLFQKKETPEILNSIFTQRPKENVSAFLALLKTPLGADLIPYLYKNANVGIDNAVAEQALRILLDGKVDCEPIRLQLHELVKERCYYRESIKRYRALLILKGMEKNDKTIDFLLEFIKHLSNATIKKIILSIFKTFEVDYFEDDEGEDDFGDL